MQKLGVWQRDKNRWINRKQIVKIIDLNISRSTLNLSTSTLKHKHWVKKSKQYPTMCYENFALNIKIWTDETRLSYTFPGWEM